MENIANEFAGYEWLLIPMFMLLSVYLISKFVLYLMAFMEERREILGELGRSDGEEHEWWRSESRRQLLMLLPVFGYRLRRLSAEWYLKRHRRRK